MSGPAHIVDIDRIVLDGVDVTRLGRTGALLEAQLAGAIAGLPEAIRSQGLRGETGIAREVARAVVASLPGARNGT